MVVRQLGASFGVKRMAGVTGMVGGISLTVPLFDQNSGAVQRATGERLAADFETRWLERTIATEVEAAYQASERLAAQAGSLQPTFLNRAEESRRIAIGAYQEGATSLLQVLDASRTLNDARVMYARIVAAANESLFELGIAAGYDPRTAATLGRTTAARTATNAQGGSR
jgi:outer membrane protein TolC